MWKERLWQLFLVAIFGLSIKMLSFSVGNYYPPLANAGISELSHSMLCIGAIKESSGVITYRRCDASDNTILSDEKITHDSAHAAGWKLISVGCSFGDCAIFHK